MNSLFVYLEIENGTVEDVSFELLTKGRELANRLNCLLEAVAIGSQLDKIEEHVSFYGVDILHIFDDVRLSPYTTLPYTSILIKLFLEEKPQIFLIGATNIGRDLAPRVSSALFSGLTADCTSLEIGDHKEKKTNKIYTNLLYQIRPAFGGNIIATIVNPDNRPQMATVREGVMKKMIYDIDYKCKIISHEITKYILASDFAVKIIDRRLESSMVNIKNSSIIIAGGYGVGSREAFGLLYNLADIIGGAVGASRSAIDAGFSELDRQIGQTGLTVRPKLYIACGISGQIQHVTGMRDSSIVVSINSDPVAPINDIADYVIIGNVETVIPKIIKYYKNNSK
ncbi:MAG: electron transfer flavoprotein subunit alpha/FixB family protein [Bacteroidales bacterium OttesenSCG-928-I14]|jgi:electron transfer flavoprotein alpha subunit|nr:electron transfer flavoprotein subunit alpha/FixB family protein [Bacteroidales bacterium OttesenSCG-928-I14]